MKPFFSQINLSSAKISAVPRSNSIGSTFAKQTKISSSTSKKLLLSSTRHFSFFAAYGSATSFCLRTTLPSKQEKNSRYLHEQSGDDAETDSEYAQKHREISNKLKKVIIKVHPDLFAAHKKHQDANQIGIQRLNALCDAIESFLRKGDPKPIEDLDSPVRFQFYVKEGQDHRVVDHKVFLPMHIFGKSMGEAAPSVIAFFDETVTQLIHHVSVAPTHHRHHHHLSKNSGKITFAKKQKTNNAAQQ